MKFPVDMPLSPALAIWLCDQGHDAVHAIGLNLARASDIAILARAEREDRVVVTADLDYPRLLAIARASAPGLILFRVGEWKEADVVERMSDVLSALSESDIARSVIVVERKRVRRRKLPLTS